MRKKLENKKGFTLAELLVVVAIIAVLIAIAIPVFAASEEKAREAVDLSAIRDAYAEAKIHRLENGKDTTTTYYFPGAKTTSFYTNLKQKDNDWQTSGAAATLNELFEASNVVNSSDTAGGTPRANGSWQLKLEGDTITLKFN